MPDRETTFRFLSEARNADGGWPYYPGRHSAAEPTCYATLALAAQLGGGHEICRGGAVWLRSTMGPGQGQPPWCKSLGLLVFSCLDMFADDRGRLARELLSFRGKQTAVSTVNELDPAIQGWSWAEGTFSWVEPTSYALLALKRNGIRDHQRIREGERLLLDRTCDDGGWNYGNRKVRGQALPSMASTTALAALALQGAPGVDSRVQRACDLLEDEAGRRLSSLAGALTILCLDVFGRPVRELGARLLERQSPDGSWRGQVQLTALSALALSTASGGTNAFRV